MRLALFSPAWFPVPPDRYGGIETVVHLLADGLVEAGVDVTLFASGDSNSRAQLVSAFATAPSEHIGESHWELATPASPARASRRLRSCPRPFRPSRANDDRPQLRLDTAHRARPADRRAGPSLRARLRARSRAGLVSLTHNQRKPQPELPWLANVNNAIDLSRYRLDRRPGDSLLFLGRMSPDKGAHRAIRIAKRVGRPLKIAAKCRQPDEIAYFDQFIAPHLDNQIEYLGEVDHKKKCALLSEAHALLMPIAWEEPFGLVIIEALASGTPIVAMRRGSIPELLRHGHTAYLADDLPGMVNALAQVTDSIATGYEQGPRKGSRSKIRSESPRHIKIMVRSGRARAAA